MKSRSWHRDGWLIWINNNVKLIKITDYVAVLKNYPPAIRKKLKSLRKLILETAKETEGVDALEETLKWRELSY